MRAPYRCAVIGNPIAHSLSPMIHQQFARAEGISLLYDKCLVTENNFEKTVADFFHQGGKGLSVTLPFKEKAFEMSAKSSDAAKTAKTANTLWCNKPDELMADNTDGKGLVADLTQYLTLKDKRILLCGAGGAAKGVIPSLLAEEIAGLHIANRTVEKGIRLASSYARVTASSFGQLQGAFDVIINATSSSLSQKTLPVSPHLFRHAFCYDMAYGKEETTFVKQANEGGASEAIDGLGMLVHQAAFAFFDWFEVNPKVAPVLNALKKSLR